MSVSRLSKQSIQTGFPKQQTIWDQFSQPAAMDALGSVFLTAGSSSVVFSNIPATYTHLQLRTYGFSSNTDCFLYFGTDTTNTNYRRSGLMGDGGSASVFNDNAPYTDPGAINSSYPHCMIFDILDYTGTTKNKISKISFGQDNNGSGRVGMESIVWYGSGTLSPISQITLSGRAFAAGTSIALYGIK